MKKKISRMDLAGVRNHFEVLSEAEQKMCMGCGSGTYEDPYTMYEFYAIMDNMNTTWSGGYVAGFGYVLPDVVCYYGGSSGYGFDFGYSPFPYIDFGYIYSNYGETINDINNAASLFSMNTAVKEGLFELAKTFDELGVAAKKYLDITKFCKRTCSIIGVGISFGEFLSKPSTKNTVKLAMTVSACLLGPGGTVVYTIADLSGGVEYLADQISRKIEEYII